MLNKEQKEAAHHIETPCVVTSGPGTGKTTLIVQKVAYLTKEKNLKPDEILALTFTEKAANEMSERLEAELNDIFISKTFHSFALDLIDEFKTEIKNLSQDYRLMDEVNALLFFVENVSTFNFSSVNITNKNSDLAFELNSTISKLKDFGVSLNGLPKLEMDMTQKSDLIPIYAAYEKYKAKYNLIDFGDVLLLALDLLKNNKKVLEILQKRFKYILVDEFQDTNLVQLEILKLLAKDNITVVGDLKQSIYSFRGANYKNLEGFKEHFKNYKEFFVSQNYRSSIKVLENVNRIVSKLGKSEELLETKSEDYGEVNLYECSNDKSQLTFILEKIKEIGELHSNTKNIGILCRRKAEVNKIVNYLETYGIKIKKCEIDDFFSTQIIKSLVTYIIATSNPKEANVEIYHMLKNCGIRNEVVQFISRKSSREKKPIYEILATENITEYTDENRLIHDIYDKITNLNEYSKTVSSIRDFVLKVISEFGFYQSAQLSSSDTDVYLLNSFLDFSDSFSKIYQTNDMSRFLQVCNLAKNSSFRIDIDDLNSSSMIEVLTIHQSKGKEFDHVIMPNINERRFPLGFRKPVFDLPNDLVKDNFLNEELRLFFVAISRAKMGLDITYVKKFLDNKLDSKPSPFLNNLDLKTEKYTKEISDLSIDIRENIKTEVLRKIGEFVLNNKFDLAKKEIDLLNNLFGKKDLNSFIKSDSHPQIKEYEDMINRNHNNFDLVNFDAKKQVFSVSQLGVYDSCPKKYLYQYVYRVPTRPKHYFDFGTSVHTALEFLSKDFDKTSDRKKLYEIGKKYLEENWISKGYENHNQEEEYMKKGEMAIKDFIEKEFELREEKRETIGQEERFDIEIDGKKLMGFIDRIDKVGDEYEILDYKTSNSMEMLSRLPQNMQLLVYSIALKQNPKYGKYPKSVGLWYLIHNKILSASPKEENVSVVKDKIKNLISNIENKKFDAKPSAFGCKFCDFNDICRDSQTK